MKLFKKLVAVVAMAAVCLSMAPAVDAEAAVLLCPHSGRKTAFVEVVFDDVIDTHWFMYATDIDKNGTPETVYVECIVTEKLVRYGFECWDCHDSIYRTSEVITEHSVTVCPFQ